MKDISTKEDIKLLVDSFYTKVLNDEIISHFFTSVVKLDWTVHIPVMYNFWESILLNSPAYKGNPMVKHIELNKRSPIDSSHFDRWLQLWKATVEENFEGSVANEAKDRATHIAGIMKFKIAQFNN